MAILVRTDRPQALLSAIRRAIQHDEIDTWSCDGEGDFTHTPEQWNERAWVRPTLRMASLRFQVIWLEGTDRDLTIEGVYYGRFIEMLLTHYSSRFEGIGVTPLIT